MGGGAWQGKWEGLAEMLCEASGASVGGLLLGLGRGLWMGMCFSHFGTGRMEMRSGLVVGRQGQTMLDLLLSVPVLKRAVV